MRINVRGDGPGAWPENSIRHLLSESATTRPGHAVLLSKMAEVLFIETLLEVALDAGYDSEAAFIRAFKSLACHPGSFASSVVEAA